MFDWRKRRRDATQTGGGNAQPADLRCSFCNKPQEEVRKLIAGPTVFICDECVAVCVDIMADDERLEPRERQFPGEHVAETGSDWRLRGQERYLSGAKLTYRQYRPYAKNPDWDHDHCEFCWATFMVEDAPDALHEGYCTLDEYRWICPTCFSDFRARFAWQVVDASTEGDA